MNKTIKPINYLRGEISLPGDKSISHRAVLIGGISSGKTRARNFLEAIDSMHTVSAFREMGVDVKVSKKEVIVFGSGLRGLAKPARKLYLGNSGTTMRILPGLLAGQNFEATLTGDPSLSKRPMKRITEPLREMGVDISAGGGDTPPLVIRGGRVNAIKYSTKVASAQVKSCILLAGLYADGVTCVTEPFTSRDHTERMLEFFGAKISKSNGTVSVVGKAELRGSEFFVPGDISSAAFFIAGAALLEGSDLTVREVGLNPTRMGFIDVLLRMGANIKVTTKIDALEPYGDIKVKFASLKSVVIEKSEVPLLIDEVPILSVLAAQARGQTIIKGISELRVKETDRIFSITENLKRMGVEIRAENENLVISGSKKRFEKAVLDSFKDHRTAMAMAIAALFSKGECIVRDTECISTSFPEFFTMLETLQT
ncbi:MAG: 3-phosphoshikimate 1-carboxyvinyltransferase [Omnitrophica bacterium]|nr:3-phosphoshikimate 1-carboxyvinyltransferase [Candidatus Omnitrophota bacterium]